MLETILADMPDTWGASYYRTSAQAEIDLVLEGPKDEVLALEIKRTLTPKVSRGFRLGLEDIRASRGYYVIPEGKSYPLGETIEAIGLCDLLSQLKKVWAEKRS